LEELGEVTRKDLIRYSLDYGANFITDSPFAVAFGKRIRTAIGRSAGRNIRMLLLSSKNRLIAPAAFCFKAGLNRASLLTWAGAGPRSRGPSLEDDEDLDDSEHSTTLIAAAYCKDIHI